jgi:acyl-CoA thioesterase-2
VSTHRSLDERIQIGLDALLRALELEPIGHDRFRVVGEPGRFDRVFGGQTLAQALTAAAATVEGKEPQSLHAYFVAGGESGHPLELAVERVRDGRSMATRRVSVVQGDRVVLIALASFHDNPDPNGVTVQRDPPATAPPEELPRLQEWVREPRDEFWVDYPPPLDIRIGESLSFLGEPSDGDQRSHWMRLPRDVGDDPTLHAALLTYASDYFLLDAVFRAHPARTAPHSLTGTSLDHAIWLHRPVRFDQWHVHTQECVVIAGDRGLARGMIHDAGGLLVATVLQEVLARPATTVRDR